MTALEDNLSALCAEAKKPAARAEIDSANADRQALYALLTAERPKTRKNAARLLGALGRERDSAALIAALNTENTLFVLPSVILALGSTGGNAARAALSAYAPPSAAEPAEEKHIAAISDALVSARAALNTEALPHYTLSQPRRLLAVSPEGFSDVLSAELVSLGYRPETVGTGCYVNAFDWEKLYRARCMSELLIPLAERLPLSAEAVAEAARAELSVPYRIELTGYTGDRTRFLKELRRACGGENSPSHYALELRVSCRGDVCSLYLKPSCDERGRYAWRARAISASVKPALGACLARYIAPRVKKDPIVLDPFCGSGTLLFSCEEAFPCQSLLGVDISLSAVQAARENAAAGRSRARFVQKDVLKFVPRERADLVVANLPFGNRVGTHENNTALYAAFLARLPSLMAPDGLALLYTMEYRLLNELLQKKDAPALIETRRTEAGGLLPWVFVLS